MREYIVPVAVMAVLASLLLPLPPPVIDLLLVANIILALVLLVSTLYITDPLRLSSLPSLLLLATLYRLALNVSTTRLILGSGEAGRVVEAFGTVVIQGSLVVGAVIFLIITLIQFIVIAKGGERVAEVSARFTLDALPGKQMSIDADVRAGLIDFNEARRKRQSLQTESQFYGALDGAMKFIKGDAIAGLVITGVNVIGGFAIGVVIQGLDVSSALSRYTLLTVGDGLLSQIPALLNSLAAGMVVTRVVCDEGASLAEDMLLQLGQIRKVKVLVGIAAVMLALAQGMPFLPFISLAVVLFVSAAMMPGENAEGSGVDKSQAPFQPRTPAVLQLEFDRELGLTIWQSAGIAGKINSFLQGVYDHHGLILLPPEAALADDLNGEFRIVMRGVPVLTQSVDAATGDPLAQMIEHLDSLVRERTEEFVDDILTRRMLDHFDSCAPELVSTVVPGVITVTQLSEVLKALVRDRVTIRNFDLILQAAAEHGRCSKNERMLLEEVRVALRRVISAQYAQAGVISGFVLDPVIDLAFVRAEREEKSFCLEHLTLIEEYLRRHVCEGEVLVVSKGARRLIKECLKLRGLNVPVLAQEELVDEVRFAAKGCIDLEEPSAREELVESLAA